MKHNTTPRELDPATVVAQLADDRDVEPAFVLARQQPSRAPRDW